jgi:hypothetical protein
MTIVHSSVFQALIVFFLIVGLGLLIVSQTKNISKFSYWGFGFTFLALLTSTFKAIIVQDWFVLPQSADYGANFLFSFCAVGLSILCVVVGSIYYRHNIIPPLFSRIGMLLISIQVLVSFSASFSQAILSKRNTNQNVKFVQSEEFQKGSPNPKLTKANLPSDSVLSR